MLASKSVRSSAVIGLLLVGIAACSESPTAPVPLSPELSAESYGPLMSRAGNDGDDADDSYDGDVQYGTRTFTIRPHRPVLKVLGEHVLWMPADVVCDPETSGYGVAFWDAPCRPLKRPIEVTAQWANVNGHEIIRFTPELRFVPSNNRFKWVYLWAKHSRNVDPAKTYAILWHNPETNEWIDEAASDPSLREQVDRRGRVVSRRLKHFSYYFVWFGVGSYNVTSGMGGDFWGGW